MFVSRTTGIRRLRGGTMAVLLRAVSTNYIDRVLLRVIAGLGHAPDRFVQLLIFDDLQALINLAGTRRGGRQRAILWRTGIGPVGITRAYSPVTAVNEQLAPLVAE